MAIKTDRWIREQTVEYGIVESLSKALVAAGVIFDGPSPQGFELRVCDEIKKITNVNSAITDPMAFVDRSFVSVQADFAAVPPDSFASTRSVEYVGTPRESQTICVGKSTYARCGTIVRVTPFEPERHGFLTLENSDTPPTVQDLRRRWT
jgi:dCTP deaminase